MMQLSTAAKAMQANLIGADAEFCSVGTDSRKIEAQQLFFALKGERFDGHAYAQAALDQGAASVVVDADSKASEQLTQALVVEDTYHALGDLAKTWREGFDYPLIGVTGSNGKTTVKEMLAAILSAHTQSQQAVLATKGNLNNHIGMPLTLLSMRESHAYAVVEMGMNHSGEIRYLTNIASPDVVVINNAGNAHLGELGSLQAIAEAKGEIIEGVKAAGTVVLNADDDFYPLWQSIAQGKKILTFGLGQADVVGAIAADDANKGVLTINAPEGEVAVQLKSPGEHNAKNALAASAVAIALAVPLTAIKAGLEAFVGVSGRLQTLDALSGSVVIDDTYNANPMSMQAAIDVLSASPGKTILVAGDMGELGEGAAKMHASLGAYASQKGIDALYTLGDLSASMSGAFGQNARHFDAIEDLVETVKAALTNDVTVLVKGSRYMKMERVVNAIKLKEQKQEKR